ncbi:hypothetical protein GCM10007897_44830 [Sphingobium jiangsuense]|nr:hypothetical protein [Sphingobium jiangsuense]GLT03042.1 hypothetical protein GCM10007897_44830 [Sphingobium jiangsuense]
MNDSTVPEMKKPGVTSAGLLIGDASRKSVLKREAGGNPTGGYVHLRHLLVNIRSRHLTEVRKMAFERRRRPRAKLTPEIVAKIRERLAMGHYQHDIAADLGVNQGRISEVNTGKR